MLLDDLAFVDPHLVQPFGGTKGLYLLNGRVWHLQENVIAQLEKELVFALDCRISERSWWWEKHGSVYRVVIQAGGKRRAVDGKAGLSMLQGLASAYCLACQVWNGGSRRLMG